MNPDRIVAFISVRIGGKLSGEIKRKFMSYDKIKEIYFVTGEYDVLMKAECSNLEDLRNLINEIRGMDEVESTYTHVVIEEIELSR